MAKAFLTMLEYLVDKPFNQQFYKQIKMSRNQLHMLYVKKGLVALVCSKGGDSSHGWRGTSGMCVSLWGFPL